MNNRIIIFIFFLVFLFVPVFLDIKVSPQQRYNSDEDKIIYAIASVSESVVGISVISEIPDQKLSWELKDGTFYPYTQKDSIIKSLGSGLIYSNNGYVVTNTHVIQNASQIFVTLSGG